MLDGDFILMNFLDLQGDLSYNILESKDFSSVYNITMFLLYFLYAAQAAIKANK